MSLRLETTAFIGSTGSGKSTLINLVPRFYEPTAGKIKINGLDIQNYAQKDLMRRIGYVPQRGVLFSGTVKSNIMFGAPELSEKQMHEAARIAQAEEFVEKLDKSTIRILLKVVVTFRVDKNNVFRSLARLRRTQIFISLMTLSQLSI